jgi:prophage antirepressor-like protein
LVAKDVCDALGLQNVTQAIERLDEDEVCQTYFTDSLGRKQLMFAISESGLYMLILRSDKPQAKPFKKWVTQEVLPAIRKTGGYQIQFRVPQTLGIARKLLLG